jgi:hypothetical protein
MEGRRKKRNHFFQYRVIVLQLSPISQKLKHCPIVQFVEVLNPTCRLPQTSKPHPTPFLFPVSANVRFSFLSSFVFFSHISLLLSSKSTLSNTSHTDIKYRFEVSSRRILALRDVTLSQHKYDGSLNFRSQHITTSMNDSDAFNFPFN